MPALCPLAFTCFADCWVLVDDYVILSAYGSRSSIGVSLLIGSSINADINLVIVDDGSDVAVKSFEFRLASVYVPNFASERASFFRRLAPFLDDPKWIVLVGD